MADTPFPKKTDGPLKEKSPLFQGEGATPYQPALSNWYTAKPYGFRFTPKTSTDANTASVMYLPINPSNLNITTHFATNIVTTLYGTVEEHSPVRYFDISIEGTTGMAPKYVEPQSWSADIAPKSGRSAFTVKASLNPAGGFFSKTFNTLQTVVKDVKNLLNGGQPPNPDTGIQLDQTGYLAFHNLYRFLLVHKSDAADPTKKRTSKAPPLVFFNHKDGNEYSVVIRTFTLRRDKENPMLYYYNIQMRGYELTGIDKSHQLGNVDDKALLERLGLTGVKGSSFLGTAKTLAGQAKDIIASVANGINQLGR